ncbi:MBL fold metallo-hydrolase [Dysgonomonas sp. BGC7]|uniref:MBL fold metallo-hydrolase n=1 Tax=Dysgonomonas sp. BGC7 TaxID=1658008 RepID=UPI0006806F09|nr:MBL fold metallo-hydrolase [Dysgonomonas sp. BGC7]MBD8389393.1 MBL fold metallo-hydrolase [Dysgonomonas sp. BGC7]
MIVKFLGTGTSTGIPEIGCRCKVCTSKNKKDRRLRASVLINIDGKKILIDCGPDFREQIMNEEFSQIHAVLLTHEHYDHVGGIDDLRPFCKFADVDIYANTITLDALKNRMPYSFSEHRYPGVPVFNLHEVEYNRVFYVSDIKIQPIGLMHFRLPILGYRINDFAYLTDVKTIPENEYKKLQGLDTLVINALRIEEHMSHLNLKEALEVIRVLAPKKTFLIHMSHHLGLHDEVQSILPNNVFLSYDGLQIEA